MLNSRNYAREENVINIGEEIAPEVDLKNPKTRIYYHQVKGAITHLPDGAQITFRGGMYATQNEEVIKFLDKLADKRGTMIFTKKSAELTRDLELAAADARVPAGDAKARLGQGDDGKLVDMSDPQKQNDIGDVKVPLGTVRQGAVVSAQK